MTQINLHATSLKTNCAFCFRHDPKLLSCKGCKTAWYCGKECQRSHWSSHKNVCKATRQINTIEIRIPMNDPEKNHASRTLPKHIRVWSQRDHFMHLLLQETEVVLLSKCKLQRDWRLANCFTDKVTSVMIITLTKRR